MTAVVRRYEQGTPGVLRYEQETIGEPREDQALVRQAAIGVNRVDIHCRNGSTRISRFSFVNGFEAAGTVEAVGPDIRDFRIGGRVAYHFAPGVYAEARLISGHRLTRLPDDVTCQQVAAIFAKYRPSAITPMTGAGLNARPLRCFRHYVQESSGTFLFGLPAFARRHRACRPGMTPRAQSRPFAEASGVVPEIRNPCTPQQSASKRSS